MLEAPGAGKVLGLVATSGFKRRKVKNAADEYQEELISVEDAAGTTAAVLDAANRDYTGTGTARAAEVMVGSTSASGVLVAVDLKLLAQDEAIAKAR